MKKVFAVLGVVCLLSVSFLFAGDFKAVKAPQDKPATPYFIMQESGSVPGTTPKAFFAGSDSTNWRVVDRNQVSTYAKAIKVFSGATAGLIYIHLIDNPTGAYDKYYLSPGDKEGVIFDRILETGTTINLDSVMILL